MLANKLAGDPILAMVTITAEKKACVDQMYKVVRYTTHQKLYGTL